MTDDFVVAYVTDRGLFLPTLRSAYSALKRTSKPLRVIFVGASLDESMWHRVEILQRSFPQSTIVSFDLPADWLREATSPKSFITPTALGRMFLPRITGGRVLYIDGDTMVTGDLSAAATIDMQGYALAGVRDFAVMRWLATGKTEQLQRQANLLGGKQYLPSYVNSGVLLLDCDMIRDTTELQTQMEDMVAAQGYPTVDQDRINVIFKDRLIHLDAAWNCSWGRLSQQRRDNGSLPTIASGNGPFIVHFHGPNKPWHPLRLSTLRKGFLATLAYRREMKLFDNAVAKDSR